MSETQTEVRNERDPMETLAELLQSSGAEPIFRHQDVRPIFVEQQQRIEALEHELSVMTVVADSNAEALVSTQADVESYKQRIAELEVAIKALLHSEPDSKEDDNAVSTAYRLVYGRDIGEVGT